MHLGIDIGGSSVKVAAVENGRVVWTAASNRYQRATTEQLVAAIRSAVGDRIGTAPQAIGLCTPGVLDRHRRLVTLSVNVPGLVDVPLDDLVAKALGANVPLHLTMDAVATGLGIWHERNLTGRLFCLALGTGIGAAVIDDGNPLRVSGESPGHFGQLDVSLDDHPPIGPDGGAGSLEAYLGLPALQARYGANLQKAVAQWQANEPPLRALARALRIAHAIYRPNHMVLAGGVGIRLTGLLPMLKTLVGTNLTSIARPDWTLSCGNSDFHAATGAAALASRSP